jgi:hypothetical protein
MLFEYRRPELLIIMKTRTVWQKEAAGMLVVTVVSNFAEDGSCCNDIGSNAQCFANPSRSIYFNRCGF